MAFAANIFRVTGPCDDLHDAVRDATSAGFSKIITPIGNPLFSDDSTPAEGRAIARMRTESALDEEFWKNNVVAQLSSVTPLWSGNPEVHDSTLKMLKSEILQANHVGCHDVCLNLSKEPHTILVDAFKEWLAYDATPRISTLFYIMVPLVNPEAVRSTYLEGGAVLDTSQDPWKWYRKFRNGVGKSTLTAFHFDVILSIPTDLSVPQVVVDRWLGEPLKHFVLHTDSFYKRRDGRLDLPSAHKQLVKKLLWYGASAVLSGPVATDVHIQAYIWCILEIKATMNLGAGEDQSRQYEDRLMRVPQPISNDLTFQEYAKLSRDTYKYALYRQAFCGALPNLRRQREERGVRNCAIRVAILGAGLGSLIDELLTVSDHLEQPVVVYAVEKNLMAYLVLTGKLSDKERSVPWKGRVRLFNEDCRSWESPEKLDAVVSDFLGCFGDDQCLTECVRPCESFLQEWGVMIPSSVTSYLTPIQSTPVFTTIPSALTKHENKPEHESHIPWLCNFRSSFAVASATPVHRERFPSRLPECERKKGWSMEVPFRALADATVHGFAGSFQAILFEDAEITNMKKPGVTLNTSTWMTAFFPFSEPLDVKQGQVFNATISRKNDGSKVWYEWSTTPGEEVSEGKASSPVIHNLDGTYHSLLLARRPPVFS